MKQLNTAAISSSLLLASLLSLAACSKTTETAPAAAPPPAPVATTAPAAARTKAPEGAKVYFVGIKDGDTVTSPFKVGFGVDVLKVAPAGTPDAGVGHHHLIIDSELPPQDAPLPANDNVKHFGKGQTETELTLPAGTHTLQIEFADSSHVPFDPPVVSDKITITVK